jgi:hypothetical protein
VAKKGDGWLSRKMGVGWLSREMGGDEQLSRETGG